MTLEHRFEHLLQRIAQHYAEWHNTPGNLRDTKWWAEWEAERKAIVTGLVNNDQLKIFEVPRDDGLKQYSLGVVI